VVNPNSTQAMTDQIATAVADLWRPEGLEVEVVTSHGGPAAIQSDADGLAAVEPMFDVAANTSADAYVVACFSDPGIDLMRERLGRPVFGIAESALLAALGRGRRVGIVSSVPASVPRHERYWERLGLASRVVADIAVGHGVLELHTPQAAADVWAVARRLVDEHDADVVILGCAGLTHMRAELEAELGVPVIDPCRAAVGAALTALQDAVPAEVVR
jgi:Asp/Glu/hydantoin racemase